MSGPRRPSRRPMPAQTVPPCSSKGSLWYLCPEVWLLRNGCGGRHMLHLRSGEQASGAAQRARAATVQCGADMPWEGRVHGRGLRRDAPRRLPQDHLFCFSAERTSVNIKSRGGVRAIPRAMCTAKSEAGPRRQDESELRKKGYYLYAGGQGTIVQVDP